MTMSELIATGALTSKHVGRKIKVQTLAINTVGTLDSVWHHQARYGRPNMTSLFLEFTGGEMKISTESTDQIELLDADTQETHDDA